MTRKPVVVKVPRQAAAIIRQPDGVITVNVAGQGLGGNNGTDGRDPGILMTWSTSTADADPGGGYLRANNASLAAATRIYIDKTTRAGSSIAAVLLAMGPGRLTITDPASKAQAFVNVGTITDATGYVKLYISGHSGADAFTAELPVSVTLPDAVAVDAALSAAGVALLGEPNQILTGGANYQPIDLGPLDGEIIFINPGDGPAQQVLNDGDGSILPAAFYGSCHLIIVNDAGAGEITTTGWILRGSAFDTDEGSKFVCTVLLFPSVQVLYVDKVA